MFGAVYVFPAQFRLAGHGTGRKPACVPRPQRGWIPGVGRARRSQRHDWLMAPPSSYVLSSEGDVKSGKTLRPKFGAIAIRGVASGAGDLLGSGRGLVRPSSYRNNDLEYGPWLGASAFPYLAPAYWISSPRRSDNARYARVVQFPSRGQRGVQKMKLMASSAAKARRAARLAGKAFSSGFVLGTERATRVDDQQVPEVRGESS